MVSRNDLQIEIKGLSLAVSPGFKTSAFLGKIACYSAERVSGFLDLIPLLIAILVFTVVPCHKRIEPQKIIYTEIQKSCTTLFLFIFMIN